MNRYRSRHNIAMTFGDEGEPTEPGMAAVDAELHDYGIQQHIGRCMARYSRWRVYCRCGHETRLMGSPDDAWAAWRRHVREAREDDE